MATEPTGQDGPHDGDDPPHGERAEGGPGAEPDAWDEVVLDESFVRGAEVSEPTARTRMLAERWKHESPDPQPWRSDEPPAGWIHGSQGRRREHSARPRRRRWFRRKGSDGDGK